MATTRRTGRLMLAGLAIAALGSGCAIHSQAPVREIAYDFSDADFYDRAYAASPQYTDHSEYEMVDAAPVVSSASPEVETIDVLDHAAR